MATKSEVFKKVQELIEESLSVDIAEVHEASSFVEDLGADSLDIVELVMAIEKEFDLEIPDEQAERIGTVRDAVDYICAQTSS